MNLSCRPWQNAYATVAPMTPDGGSEHGGLSHARLSIIDLAGGHQPMVKSGSGQTFAIVYNGELYNTDELRQELMAAGYSFQTSSDTAEVILAGYMEYGP